MFIFYSDDVSFAERIKEREDLLRTAVKILGFLNDAQYVMKWNFLNLIFCNYLLFSVLAPNCQRRFPPVQIQTRHLVQLRRNKRKRDKTHMQIAEVQVEVNRAHQQMTRGQAIWGHQMYGPKNHSMHKHYTNCVGHL